MGPSGPIEHLNIDEEIMHKCDKQKQSVDDLRQVFIQPQCNLYQRIRQWEINGSINFFRQSEF